MHQIDVIDYERFGCSATFYLTSPFRDLLYHGASAVLQETAGELDGMETGDAFGARPSAAAVTNAAAPAPAAAHAAAAAAQPPAAHSWSDSSDLFDPSSQVRRLRVNLGRGYFFFNGNNSGDEF